jgi:PleD family two-component response regulator
LPARDRSSSFLLWLPGATPEAAAAVAGRIRQGVESCRIRRQDTEPVIEPVSVVIGIAAVSAGETLTAALARAAAAVTA